jgi:hypothetical protein
MNPAWKKIIFHILLPLVIGLLLYIFTNPDTWIVQQLLPQHLYRRQIQTDHWTLRLLEDSGADFCWSYSFAAALFLWRELSGTQSKYFGFTVLLIVLLFEVVQLFFSNYLTFDPVDLLAAFLAVLLSWYLNRPVHHDKKV